MREIVITILLFLLNGLFSMAEIAIVSARKVRLEGLAKRGSRGAAIAKKLAEDPTRFLSTVQVGITLIGIVTGFYSGSVFSVKAAAMLLRLGVPAAYAETAGIIVVVVATTYLSLILGELVPKKIGLLNPEGIASLAAPPMQFISKISAPVVTLLTVSTNLLVRLLNLKVKDEEEVTEEEVRSLIAQGTSSGTFEKIEQDLVERVFHFSDRKVGSLMTNRINVDWVDLEDGVDKILEEVAQSEHSHILVCRGGFDDVVGVLPLRKLMQRVLAERAMPDIISLIEKPIYMPDSMGVLRAVEKLKDKIHHLAIVVNEFGSVQGVLTLNDVFEGLILDLDQQQEGLDNITERDDGSFLMDGTLPFAEFTAHFEVDADDEELAGFHTLAGFFLNQFKQFPQAGDKIIWKGYRFEIVDMDGRRIDKLLVIPPAAPTALDLAEEV